MITYRIKDWGERYENHRTRVLKRMEFVLVPNRMDSDGYTELLDHEDGVAHFGVWFMLLQIASRCEPRGTLLRAKGIPHDVVSLCRISRAPVALFQAAIDRLVDIGWIESEVAEEGLTAQESVVCNDPALTRRESGAPDGANPAPIGAIIQRKSSDERKNGIEGNRTERNGTEAARASVPPWKSDPQYSRFATDYLSTGAALIDADFAAAYDSWQRLNLGQRLERVASLNRHMGEYAGNPRFVPKPLKFLETEWERPLRPAPVPVVIPRKDSLIERTTALIQKRIANGEPPL